MKINLNELKAELCIRSFYRFVQEFWSEIIPEEPVYNWHIRYICEELQKITPNLLERKPKLYDLLINIPPGTTKSTIVTVMFPAWLWALDPTIRTISNSYASDISTDHAVKSRDVIQSDKYKEYFPHVVLRNDRRGKQSYETTNNGARYVTSTGGAITGKHAHLIINDDPQNPKQAESEAHRKQSVDHAKTLATRKVNKESAVTITVMQRLNQKDVSGYLLTTKTEDLKHIKLPAFLTDKTIPLPEGNEFDGKPLKDFYKDNLLDIKRLTKRSLDEMLVDLGTRGYNGQMQQNPTSEEGDIVKKDWFKVIGLNEFNTLRLRNSNPTVHFYADTAFTDKSENDPSGIIGAVRIDNNVYITCRRKVRKTFPDLIKFIPNFVMSNGYSDSSKISIEPKANGLSVIHSLQRETNLNVTATESPKDDKKTRLYSISPKIEVGRVILVEGTWNEEFIEEIAGFPNAEHDEDVDVLCYAVDDLLNNYIGGTELTTNLLW